MKTTAYRLIDRETKEISDIVWLTHKECEEAKEQYIVLKASSIVLL